MLSPLRFRPLRALRPRRTVFPRLARVAAALVLAGAVAGACSDTGPVFPTSDRLDDWVTAPASLVARSDRAPVIDGGLATFRLGRGERLSALRAGHEWGVDQTYLFGFDLRVDPATLGRAPVILSRLQRLGDPATDLVSVRLDPRNGVTVLGRRCIAPRDLNRWHSVEIRIAFTDGDTGFLEVFCDRRPIWAQQQFRTTLPPTCRRAQGCTTPVPRPARFEWQVGLIAPRGAARAFAVQMQRIFYHRLFVIPNRVGTL